MPRHCQSDHYFKPDRNLRQTKTQDSNQSLFNFGITVKRYYNIFKERDTHTHTRCHPQHHTAYLPFTLYWNQSFHHILSQLTLSHTIHLFLSLNILLIIQLLVKYTHILLQKSRIQTQACTQWAVYLRLLLLGCDPARPGWSGLWRFCGGAETELSHL